MQADNMKLLFTYTIALVIVAGGGLLLFASRNDPNPGDLQLVLAGFIGAAIQYVFQRETQTQTARQVERSFASRHALLPHDTTPGTTPGL